MDAELKQYLEGMEERLRTQVDEARAHTEVVETRLLSEFWKWARTADAPYRQNQSIVGGLDTRVQLIEDRISELERRQAS